MMERMETLSDLSKLEKNCQGETGNPALEKKFKSLERGGRRNKSTLSDYELGDVKS